jgi:predicted PurR-regulated permease PerM
VDVSSKYFRVIVSVFVTLLCIYMIAQLRDFFHDIWTVMKALLIPFLAAMVVAYILQPIVEILVRRRVPRGAAILIIYFTFALIVIAAVLQAIPVVAKQMTQLGNHIPDLVAQADKWMDQISARKQYLPDALRHGVEAALGQFERNLTAYATQLVSMVTSTVGAIFIAFVVPFLVFYMLKDARAMGRAFVHLVPHKYRTQARDILAGVDTTLGSYVRGQLLVMVTVGILTYAGLLIIKMPYALLLALFLAIMDIIPYLGPFIGAAPALILGISISPGMALKVLIVNLIVQQCEGNLISPQIMGRTLHLHPMAIVAALLISGEIGGVLGLVCAVPVLAVIKVIYTNIRDFKPPQPDS